MNRDAVASADLEVLDLAVELARRAGRIQRDRYETHFDVHTKSATIDLVTEVDRECEALIIAALQEQRSADAVLAEEGGGDDHGRGGWRWIIDPLDGTTNYAHGFPRFCVSIGVQYEGEMRVGVVYDPLLDELFTAARGAGAWLGDRALRVSSTSDFGEALVATGFAYDVHRSQDDNLARFAKVLKSARGIRRDGSAALDLCYVAAGRLDAYWEFKLHAWDVAAGSLIVEEAGGRVTDIAGGPMPSSGEEVVSSNGKLHEVILAQMEL